MQIREIPSIPGALAREDGTVKTPDVQAEMPNGGVRNYKTKWVRGSKCRAGGNARHEHYGIRYRGKNYKMHRLICEAFHGTAPDGKPIVIHLDENSLNNEPANLRWGTQKENMNAPGFVAYCRSRTGDNSPTTKARKAKLTP